MTKSELHKHRLVREAEQRVLHHVTRRHFLKESAMGFGALALGSLMGSCGSGSANATAANSIVFDPAHPLLPKSPHFPG